MIDRETLVTDLNIDDVKHELPCDQADQLVIGCRSWKIRVEGIPDLGAMTIWPNDRAAYCTNGNSDWGEWDEYAGVLLLDNGEWRNQSGELVPD